MMWSEMMESMWYSLRVMTAVQRHFLGWDTPFLPAVSNWLLEHRLQGGLGIANTLLVLVSGQAIARRLGTHFLNDANKEDRAVELPSIVTSAQFFKQLVPKRIRLADKQTTLLATITVLKRIPATTLQTIVGERPVKENDFIAWLQVANKILETIRIASSGGLSIDISTWPTHAQNILTPDSIVRFALIYEIQMQVEKLLANEGMGIFELLQLDLVQPRSELNLGGIKNITVVGGSDLSSAATLMLDRLLDEGIKVDALIRSPESEEDGFDQYGCLITSYWMSKMIDVDEENIVVNGSPSSQSTEVVRVLSSLKDEVSTDQITISATDEKLIPILQRHIQGHNVQSRYAGGLPTLQTPEALLVSGIADFISSQSYASYASLVRHPEISKIAVVNEMTLEQLSNYSANVVPNQINSQRWFFPKESRCCFDLLEKLHAQMFDFFKPYISLDKKPDSISVCSSAIRKLLITMYGEDELDRTSMRLKALQKLFGVLDSFDAIPQHISDKVGNVRLSEVMRFMLRDLEQDTIPEFPNHKAIETVGWLEGMVVDTPYLIVVGMSSELGGANNPSDAYFPNRLLDLLGLESIERRMARDSHAIIAMEQSRVQHGNITWIVGRVNTDGDPQSPSPLLMRCKNSKKLATLAGRLVVPFENEKPEVPPQYAFEKEGNGIPIPKPSDHQFEPLKKLRVTGFKDYIACSYRFWLKHVRDLKVAEDGNTELDAKLFGIFVHAVLERFGEDKSMRSVSDLKKIEQRVFSDLEDVAKEQLGSNMSNKIKIQIELARVRLKEFAKHQSKSVEEGWTIVSAERFIEKEIDVQGRKFVIRGTIDRVETNSNGEVRVLDYKTGSTTANKAHFTKDSWIDLQLPLYRELLTKISELDGLKLDEENVTLGYFKIGDQESTSGIDLLTPKEEMQSILQDTIESTINSILDNEYSETPVVPAPKFSDEYSWICQDDSVVEESRGDYDG